MEYEFIEEYLLGGVKPTLQEIRTIFPTLDVHDTHLQGFDFGSQTQDENKSFTLDFHDRKIIIYLHMPSRVQWKCKILTSTKDLLYLRDTLINFIFCKNSKVPDVYSWTDKFIDRRIDRNRAK